MNLISGQVKSESNIHSEKESIMKKSIATFSTIFSLLLFFDPCMLIAQPMSFTGQGSAVIIADDQIGAERLATEAALKKAVSLAMESLIQKGTKEETNYHLKKRGILNEAIRLITGRRLIARKISGKLLTIDIGVVIDREKLSRFLKQRGIMMMQTEARKKASFPSIMVMVAEEIGGKLNRFPYSSNTIVHELMGKQFDVVDETVIRKSIHHDQAVQGVLKGDAKAARAMALQYGAGIMITGRAVSQAGGLKSGAMQAYGADVALQAIHTDSGRVIASASASGSYPHIEAITGSRKAIEEASRKAMGKLLKEIEKSFESSEEIVLVSISGINFSQLAVLKKILARDFKSIISIQQKNYAGGVAKLNIKIDANPESFAEKVALKDFRSFRLNVLSFSPRKIDFTLKMKR